MATTAAPVSPNATYPADALAKLFAPPERERPPISFAGCFKRPEPRGRTFIPQARTTPFPRRS